MADGVGDREPAVMAQTISFKSIRSRMKTKTKTGNLHPQLDLPRWFNHSGHAHDAGRHFQTSRHTLEVEIGTHKAPPPTVE